MTPMRLAEIGSVAARLLRGIELLKPIDLDAVARQNDVRVHHTGLDHEVSGFTFFGKHGPNVVLNSARNHARQRFTLAHELGHIFLHPAWLETVTHVIGEFRIAHRRDIALSPLEALEEEANFFALELLLPYSLVDDLGLNGWDIDNVSDLDTHAAAFQVNTETLRYRMSTRR